MNNKNIKNLAFFTTIGIGLCAFAIIINKSMLGIADINNAKADYVYNIQTWYSIVNNNPNIQNNWLWWNYDLNGKKTWSWRESNKRWYRLTNYKDGLQNWKASYYSYTDIWSVQNQNYVNGVLQWSYEYISLDGYRIIWNINNNEYDWLLSFYDPNWLTININFNNWIAIGKAAVFQNWPLVISFDFVNNKVDKNSIKINNKNNDPQLSQKFQSSLYYFSNYFDSNDFKNNSSNYKSDYNINFNDTSNFYSGNITSIIDEWQNWVWEYDENGKKMWKWIYNKSNIYLVAYYSNWWKNTIVDAIQSNWVKIKFDIINWETEWIFTHYFPDWTKSILKYENWNVLENIYYDNNWLQLNIPFKDDKPFWNIKIFRDGKIALIYNVEDKNNFNNYVFYDKSDDFSKLYNESVLRFSNNSDSIY